MSEQIAFLGTGRLGAGFVEYALKRGDRVTVWNRSPEKLAPLAALGATIAATPADAVRGAARVHLVLKDDESVEEVIAAFRSALGTGVVICDHTTTLPTKTAARATRLNAEGVAYLHCPVFIGPPAARQGKGTIMAAGSRALFDQVAEALGRQAERVEYIGERPDAAAILKLAGNLMIIGACGLVADMLTLTTQAGITPDEALHLFDFFNPMAGAMVRGKAMAARDWTPNFELTMARKDVRLMLETINGEPLAALPGIAQRMDDLIRAGHGGDDMGILGVDAVN